MYNKVNPIFHHWRVEDKKFGLTFQSPAEAISFERGIQSVLDKLERGTKRWSSIANDKQRGTCVFLCQIGFIQRCLVWGFELRELSVFQLLDLKFCA